MFDDQNNTGGGLPSNMPASPQVPQDPQVMDDNSGVSSDAFVPPQINPVSAVDAGVLKPKAAPNAIPEPPDMLSNDPFDSTPEPDFAPTASEQKAQEYFGVNPVPPVANQTPQAVPDPFAAPTVPSSETVDPFSEPVMPSRSQNNDPFTPIQNETVSPMFTSDEAIATSSVSSDPFQSAEGTMPEPMMPVSDSFAVDSQAMTNDSQLPNDLPAYNPGASMDDPFATPSAQTMPQMSEPTVDPFEVTPTQAAQTDFAQNSESFTTPPVSMTEEIPQPVSPMPEPIAQTMPEPMMPVATDPFAQGSEAVDMFSAPQQMPQPAMPNAESPFAEPASMPAPQGPREFQPEDFAPQAQMPEPTVAQGQGMFEAPVPQQNMGSVHEENIYAGDYQEKEPGFLKLVMAFVITLVVVAGLVGGGWWLYSSFMVEDNSEPLSVPVDTAEDVDNNQTPENDNTFPESDTTNRVDSEEEVLDEEGLDELDSLLLFGDDIDSDEDGLSDSEEAVLGTDMYNWDTDGDGLDDNAEVNVWKTDPKDMDTDKDTYLDGEEVLAGYNPLGDGRLTESFQDLPEANREDFVAEDALPEPEPEVTTTLEVTTSTATSTL